MNIAEFLPPLVFCKNIKVVVALLPERALLASPHDRQLQRLQRRGEQLSARFGQQQMHVFRHHHVANDVEFIATMYLLQRIFKEISGLGSIKIREPVMTTERHEV
jgi:predicted metallo-beta-lactamase superfamily hydrolase